MRLPPTRRDVIVFQTGDAITRYRSPRRERLYWLVVWRVLFTWLRTVALAGIGGTAVLMLAELIARI